MKTLKVTMLVVLSALGFNLTDAAFAQDRGNRQDQNGTNTNKSNTNSSSRQSYGNQNNQNQNNQNYQGQNNSGRGNNTQAYQMPGNRNDQG